MLAFRSFFALAVFLLSAAIATAQTRPPPTRLPVQVDLELILAVDVSGSMDGPEQAFQRAGYLAAIPHPDVVRAIRSGPNQRIALTYVEWAGYNRNAITVPWRIVSDMASAKAFAGQLAATPVAYLRGTSISGALDFGARYFAESGVTSLRRVIDISGDGPNNVGPPVLTLRDEVLAKGIVINGLPIMLAPTLARRMGVGLDIYYRDCVIGGPGSFVLPLLKSEDWASAIRRKLILEIAGRPARAIRVQQKPEAQETKTTDCLIGEQLRREWNDY